MFFNSEHEHYKHLILCVKTSLKQPVMTWKRASLDHSVCDPLLVHVQALRDLETLRHRFWPSPVKLDLHDENIHGSATWSYNIYSTGNQFFSDFNPHSRLRLRPAITSFDVPSIVHVYISEKRETTNSFSGDIICSLFAQWALQSPVRSGKKYLINACKNFICLLGE